MANRVIFGDWVKGIGFDKYDQAAFDRMRNCDITTEPGSLRPNFYLQKDTAKSVSTAYLTCISPAGSVYFFSKGGGDIFKYKADGTYADLTDNSNTTGHLGCKFFDGRIYYATATKLGRFDTDSDGNRDDNWRTFKHSDTTYKPMEVQNNILHIGDGNHVCSVNSSSVSSGFTTGADYAMTLESKHIVTNLKRYGFDLLIFTNAGTSTVEAGVFRWDTSSGSWSSEDYINEVGINFVVSSDNSDDVYICAGKDGNIYQ
jgi:hypothetical protein